MRVSFTPPDGDPIRWDYVAEDVWADDAEAIEKRFGASWEQFGAAVMQGSMRARRVLLWHLMKTDHPKLRYEDVPKFRAKDLLVEFTSAELVEIRGRLEKANLPEDEREQVLSALDYQIAETVAREGLDAAPDADAGKAPSATSAVSTG